MWKLIFKNIWSRRRQNGWLMAELVLVTIVTWVIIDPVVVSIHDISLPMGYDEDRLCVVKLNNKKTLTEDYSYGGTEGQITLINKLKNHPDVEQVCPLKEPYISSNGRSTSVYWKDTTQINVAFVRFYTQQDYFKAYGIKTVPGYPDATALGALDFGPNEIVITRSMAESFFPGESAIGKQFYSFWKDTTWFRIRGVVEDVRLRPTYRTSSVVFQPYTYEPQPGSVDVLLRLKPGVSMPRFLHEFQPYMETELEAGDWLATGITSYAQMNEDRKYSSGMTNTIRLNTALAVFFLLNLCLGVIGTFWLQTRKRSEEAGIMRSFGATSGKVLRTLLAEGAVLATVAVTAGCFLYFQYAMSEGLYLGFDGLVFDQQQKTGFSENVENMPMDMMDYWVTDFGTHFAGVSAIVFLIILIVVLVGIYIPARNISRVNPVEALKDE